MIQEEQERFAAELEEFKGTHQHHQTTDDIFGKDLKDFKVRPNQNQNQLEGVPIIFELIKGYFLKDDEKHLKKQGIFRITSTRDDINKLALHLSQGNYAVLNDEEF